MSMSRLDGLKILIAEDEPFMRNVLEKTLVREGAWVAPCVDGADALSTAASALLVDIIMLDFLMPKVHGLFALKKIRTGKAGVRYDIPVGLLTSASESKVVNVSMALDCDAFIIKPFNKVQLLERVERLRHRIGRKLKEPSQYEKVNAGLPDDPTSLPDPGAEADDGKTVMVSANGARLDIGALSVGMVLIEDLKSQSDDVIVPAETTLTEALVTLLRNLDAIKPLRPVAIRH
jgi:CheY-like chemotaxis protein